MINQVLIDENFYLVKAISHMMKLPELPTFDYNDMLQAGYEGLCNASEKFDASKNKKFSSYAHSMIRWEILGQYRKQFLVNSDAIKKGVEKAVFEDVTLHTNDFIFQEKLEILDDIIETLSPRQKEVIYKRYFLDMSVNEIAQELELYKSGIKLTLKNALLKMRKAII